MYLPPLCCLLGANTVSPGPPRPLLIGFLVSTPASWSSSPCSTARAFVRSDQACSQLSNSFLSRCEVSEQPLPGPVAPYPLAPEQAFELFLHVFPEYAKYTPASGPLHSLFISQGRVGCLPRAHGRQPCPKAASVIRWLCTLQSCSPLLLKSVFLLEKRSRCVWVAVPS